MLCTLSDTVAQDLDSNNNELNKPAFNGHEEDQDVQMQAPDVGVSAGKGEGEASGNADASV